MAFQSATGTLTEEAYSELSERTNATSGDSRKKVYGLFGHYQKLKRQNRDYDTADRSASLDENVGTH